MTGVDTNAINLFFYSKARAGGNVSSRYLHPNGFECVWEYNLELTRPEEIQDQRCPNTRRFQQQAT